MIIILVLLDQMLKFGIAQSKPDISIISDFFNIGYVENTGTIFGLFEGNNIIFVIISFIICILLSIFISKHTRKKSVKEKCYFLILAGGIGNLIDRIFRGFVIDYISLKWIGVFNFSDIYIVLGIILVIILEIRELCTDESEKERNFYDQ